MEHVCPTIDKDKASDKGKAVASGDEERTFVHSIKRASRNLGLTSGGCDAEFIRIMVANFFSFF